MYWTVISSVLIAAVAAVDPLVDLGYAKYQGHTIGGDVNEWLAIRYAAPPTGNNRFAAPQPPAQETTVQDATKEGALCVAAGKQEGLQFDSARQFMAEDCLFLAVYAPANATPESNLPVMFFIQGGGFSQNSNGNFNGTGLVRASGGNMIVVRINYRVGILGFGAGLKLVSNPTGSVNNGLKDMIAAAQWVKQFIPKFGGNASHIVMTGDSAGGNAGDVLLVTNGGKGFPDLFVGYIADSTSWGGTGFIADADSNFEKNVAAMGCTADPDPIGCMRKIPIADFQNKTTGGFGPVIDGTLLTANHFQLYEADAFQKVPVIYGTASDEGTPNFISNQSLATEADLLSQMQNKFSSATPDELTTLLKQYPDSLNQASFFGRDVTPNPANVAARQGTGAQWQRDAAIFTEIKLVCTSLFFSDMHAAANDNVFQYRYNMLDTTPGGFRDKGLFSQHTSQLYSIWGPNSTDGGDPKCLTLPAAQGGCAESVTITQSYWISFVRTLNPNTLKSADLPEWKPYKVCEQNRLVIDNGAASMEVVGQAVGEVKPEGLDQSKRCRGLSGQLSKSIPANLKAGEKLQPFANGTRIDPTLQCQTTSAAPAPAGSAAPAARVRALEFHKAPKRFSF